ncbi:MULTISPECIES: helix-turn-helix domain-containing protein [unclassified Acidovorax]|uniref:helix-turn-helix domain-containing protein n=1 Tax=unclassified Acidovorax TaxID=2684926 RepID=UPI000B40387D|nr:MULTISPECIES: helix-turn-helix domain-containing protein [unclassified Acidovorax]
MATASKKVIPRGRPVGSKSTDPTIAKAFGQAVVLLRTAKGLSQESVGLAAAIGRSNMSSIENGRTVPNFVGAVKIAAALGCSLPVLSREFERAYKELLQGTEGDEPAR